MKNIVLVDGSSYLFRAYHALPSLLSSSGEPTGAILGVINMLKKLIKTYKSEYIAIIFDAKGKSFRNDIYPKYKANRKAMDDELRVQIKPLHNIIKKMGLPLIIVDGVEADDVIGTLSRGIDKKNYRVVISTSDKDMIQLVDEKTVLFDSMKNITTDVSRVFDQYEICPNQMIDYLALMGDTSDNIPGIPSVGPKTAIKWLKKYENIDGVINNKDDIKGKVGENLRNNIELLKVSYKLATIKCDLDLNLDLNDLKCKNADNIALAKIFTHYGFNTLLQSLNITVSNKVVYPLKEMNIDYKIILKIEELEELIFKLNKSISFAFNFETEFSDTYEQKILGLSFCIEEGYSHYIPIEHSHFDVPQQLEFKVILNSLKSVFMNTKITKIIHDFKFCKKILSKYGINIDDTSINDIMIMSYVLNTTGKHDIQTISEKYTGINLIKKLNRTVKQESLSQFELKKVAKYASKNVDMNFRLFNIFNKLFVENSILNKLFSEIEMPLVIILNNMENIGVKIDLEKIQNHSEELRKKILKLESKCFELCGQKFNLSSPAQLREVLFKKMGLTAVKKTAKGENSTSEEVLKELAQESEVAIVIMEYRHICKLKNTYTDKLPDMLDANARVHTSYNQTGTVTGRLSSSEPNLQNIPIKSTEGRKIREAFVAEDGFIIMSADYSQIELRIMAHLSKDLNLLKAFNNGLDIHSATDQKYLE